MNNKIIITGLDFDMEEIESINKELLNRDIELKTLSTKLLIGTEVVVIIIQLIENIGYNAAYDIFKFGLTTIINKLKRTKKKRTTVEITCNGKTESIFVDFELSESQKDKLIDAIAMKFIEGIDKKGNTDNNE